MDVKVWDLIWRNGHNLTVGRFLNNHHSSVECLQEGILWSLRVREMSTCGKSTSTIVTHPNQSSMCDVNLSIASSKVGGNLDSEVLVRRQGAFVILGLEWSIIENNAHIFVGGNASLSGARRDADGHCHLCRAGNSIWALDLNNHVTALVEPLAGGGEANLCGLGQSNSD